MIIWLASYPRSGNTFLRVILNSVFDAHSYSIYDDRNDIASSDETSRAVGHKLLPRDFDLETARHSKEIYLIKTHDKPPNDTDKAIYLIRDGRECMLSYTKYQNKYGKIHKELIDTINGNTHFGSWREHIKAWDPKNRDNTLLIKFEDLIDDPYSFIDAIASFTDIDPTGNNIPTFDELHKKNDKFFASGKKDTWKEHFSEEESNLFWLQNYHEMLQFDYRNDIPELFKGESLAKEDALTIVDHLTSYWTFNMESSLRLSFFNNELKSKNQKLTVRLAEEQKKIEKVKNSFWGRLLLKRLDSK